MTTASGGLGSAPRTISDSLRRLAAAVLGWRARRADARAKAICPVDDRAFTPLYSNGVCPLCGWAPDGYTYRAPLFAPYDRYWGAIAGIAAISAVMCIAVVIAYTRT